VRSGEDTGRSTDIPEESIEILERYGETGSRYSKIRENPCKLQRDLGKIQSGYRSGSGGERAMGNAKGSVGDPG
jgi:hypothetical protein